MSLRRSSCGLACGRQRDRPTSTIPTATVFLRPLAAFAVGAILAMASVMICYQSLQAIGAQHGPPGRNPALVLLAAIARRGAMSVVKFRVGRRLRSAALIADAWNDSVDFLSAFAALTAVALA